MVYPAGVTGGTRDAAPTRQGGPASADATESWLPSFLATWPGKVFALAEAEEVVVAARRREVESAARALTDQVVTQAHDDQTAGGAQARSNH